MSTIAERGRHVLSRAPGGRRKPRDLAELSRELISRRGEASGVVLAREIFERWDALASEEKLAFLLRLVDEFGPDEPRFERALADVMKDRNPQSLLELHLAAEPRRQELIRRLNLAPGGTAKLLRMREELFRHQREHPALDALDADFDHLFSSWFNRGFLVLRRIDWTTPANILEKIIRYEAVHEIRDWDELRARIEPADRRLFAFFHPQMADDPLIFVEVALTAEIPDAIAPLLRNDRAPIEARAATTAVFYSISNCHEGLRGVSFGNFLIKQVVDELKRELPRLDCFVTLSPVPGFARWLAKERADEDSPMLARADAQALAPLDEAGWTDDPAIVEGIREPLLAAAACYFLKARDEKGRPVDPVARFHLGNGARLERLNFLADRSPKGLKQSHGLMVNYLYDLDSIEANHESFFERDAIAAASAVRRKLRGEQRALAIVKS